MAGVYPVKAALAVAMAKEIGDVDALKDLTVVSGKVQLSSVGRAACEARGGCHNVEGLLAMQDDSVSSYIDQTLFNPTSYRRDLVASFDRQRSHELNLTLNAPSRLPEPESLTLTGTQSLPGACGTHYVFDAFKAGCTGSSCVLSNPANEVNRLIFFGLDADGVHGNPFIAFFSTDASIAIDPTPSLNGGVDGSSACETGFAKYDPSGDSEGTCCSSGGSQGTWAEAPWNETFFYCQR